MAPISPNDTSDFAESSRDEMPLITSMTGMFLSRLADEVVQAVEGDRADDDGLRAGGDAILDLRDLLVELGVAARLDQLHLNALALRLLGRAVIDASQ